ncbi:hypothetical protein DM02DRAFT_619397, partial [Periconia macrospinosa]
MDCSGVDRDLCGNRRSFDEMRQPTPRQRPPCRRTFAPPGMEERVQDLEGELSRQQSQIREMHPRDAATDRGSFRCAVPRAAARRL